MSTTETTKFQARSGGYSIGPECDSLDEVRAMIARDFPHMVGMCQVTRRVVRPTYTESTAPVFTDRHFTGRRNAAEEASFGF